MMLGLSNLKFEPSPKNLFQHTKKIQYGAGMGTGRVMSTPKPVPALYRFLAYPLHTYFFPIFHTYTHY